MHIFDQLTEPELKRLFNEFGEIISAMLPPGTAFVFMATPFENTAPWQYVSSANKDDMKRAFKELLDRWDEPGHDIPR